MKLDDFKTAVAEVLKKEEVLRGSVRSQKREELKPDRKFVDRAWMAFEDACFSGRGGIRLDDVPFPTKDMLSKQCKEMDSKEVIKIMILRWHPDKFGPKYGSCICIEHRETVMQRVKEAFQMISTFKKT